LPCGKRRWGTMSSPSKPSACGVREDQDKTDRHNRKSLGCFTQPSTQRYESMKALRSLKAGYCLETSSGISLYPALSRARTGHCDGEDGGRRRGRRRRTRSHCLKPESFLRLAMLAVCLVESKGVTLQWDTNSETDLAGYKLYYGQTNTAATIVNTTRTSVTLTNLTVGKTYYFYATAYNTSGLESVPSSQVTYTIPQSTAPTISNIPDQTIAANSSTGPISFSINDNDTPAANLTLAATSSNPALAPTASIMFGGSGTNRTVTVTPASSQSGTATITVTVSDGSNSASDSFLLTVNSAAPTISNIPDQAIAANGSTGPIGFSVNDNDTPAANLSLSGSSSNPTLVPTSNIVFGGSGTGRTINVTPAPSQSGSATITVTVSDGTKSASDSFVLAVNATAAAPTISNIPDQTIAMSGATGPISFTVNDSDTPANNLTLSGNSSNPTLVPVSNIAFGGSGTNRSVTVTPAGSQSGTATITVSVSDGSQSASGSFLLTVQAQVNSASFTNSATITIPDKGNATPYPSTINVSGLEGTISNLTVTLRNLTHTWTGDLDALLVGPTGQAVVLFSDVGNGPANNVTFTLSDSASAALPNSPISSGTFRPMDYTDSSGPDVYSSPAPAGPYASALSVFSGLSANGAWSLYVGDDGPGDQGSFAGGWNLTITTSSSSSSSGPTISSIPDQSTSAGIRTQPIPFIINDADTLSSNLSLTGSSSNPVLVPNGKIAFGGSGSNRTVTITPASGQTGSTTITLTVSDGQKQASTSFKLTVNPFVGTRTFSNSSVITVPDEGNATPYPSAMSVSGMGGTITKVTVKLKSLTHTWTGDLDILLAGPTGSAVVLASDVGSGPANSVTFTLSDSAATVLPNSPISAGTFRPANYTDGSGPDVYPSPAPAGPYASALSAFNGLSANGTWSLYVVDDGPGDQGNFATGWSISITTSGSMSASSLVSTLGIDDPVLISEPATPSLGINDNGENVTIHAVGTGGQKYTIESSTDLISWEPIETMPDALGMIQLNDPKRDKRFYRLVETP
jgi:subtilisin-like proprotein convertase family protein